jgi:hypothetical protein
MGPLIIPNSFLYSHKENKNIDNINNNTIIQKNNIYNNYLSHKNSTSEVNSLFICSNSISNSNTTCNTHTNSNNKSSNSFHKSILKKIQKILFVVE